MFTTNIIITDKDIQAGITSCFRSAVKGISYHYHVAFLEVCKSYNIVPKGLVVNKRPFISFSSDELTAAWKETLQATQATLIETLIVGIFRKLTDFEIDFWEEMCRVVERSTEEEFSDWAVKLLVYLEKHEKRCREKKCKKLKKLLPKCYLEEALQRMREHEGYLTFKTEIYDFLQEINCDIPNLVNLNLIGSSFMSNNNDSTLKDNSILQNNSTLTPEIPASLEYHSGPCEAVNNRYIGKFVSDNVVNLSSKNLSAAEISLLSKGLKFVPTPTHVDRAVLKAELETFGRRLRLKWHFRNSESTTAINPFRRKSTFNPKGADTAIEMYLSCLEEEILNLDTNLKYSNLSREERSALQDLRNDSSIIIKEADKGSAVVVWDRLDYISEAERQLRDGEV